MNLKINKKSVCIGVALLCLFLSAAPMKSWGGEVQFDPYASIRMYTGYYNEGGVAGAADDLDMQFELLGNSRFGGDFTIGDRWSGNVEIAMKDTITLRRAFVVYKFDSFEVLIGNEWTPNGFGSSEVSAGANASGGFGATDDVRKKQIRITSNGGAYLCFLKPTLEPDIGDYDADTIDSKMPEVVVGYEYSSGVLNFGLGVGYQTYELDDGNGIGFDGKEISSMLGFLHGVIGTDTVSLKFNMGGGTNFGNLNIIGGRLNWKAQADAGEGIEDTNCFEGFGEVSIKLDKSVLRVGSGYAQADNDIWKKTDSQWQVFVNVNIPVFELVSLTPEFSYHDYMEDINGVDQGAEWWAGAHFQIDFR